eukprot:scaffold56580_cov52-Attheya_sp.AAC.4
MVLLRASYAVTSDGKFLSRGIPAHRGLHCGPEGRVGTSIHASFRVHRLVRLVGPLCFGIPANKWDETKE